MYQSRLNWSQAALRNPTSSSVDLDGLYRSSATRLAGIVRRELRPPEAVVEDACQAAWSKLALHRDLIGREVAFSWLATTALREAGRLVARADRDVSLEASLGDGVSSAAFCLPEHAEPQSLVADRLRIDDLRRLSRRQQRLVWLQALGCSYEEIATLSGCTSRTVHRQIHRARKRLRELATESE